MKLAVVVLCLSVAVMCAMIYQALRQELQLRGLRTRMAENVADVKTKERAIVDVKKKIEELKASLSSVSANTEQLKSKKAAAEKSAQELDQGLQACNKDKAEAEKKTSDVTDAIAKLKTDHEAAKTTAEQEIQSLKQQILDRDKAICAYADATKEEARKLCGIAEAPK